jgi:hypothetical protein
MKLFFILTMVLFGSAAHAALTGRIVDMQGKPVQNLQINITIEKLAFKAQTDTGGYFSLDTSLDGHGYLEVFVNSQMIRYNVYSTTRYPHPYYVLTLLHDKERYYFVRRR